MRLIDADKLCRRLNDRGIEFDANINDVILSMPIIDIVRCKECAKRMREDCPMCNGCKLDRVPTDDDDYCSYGEREVK